MANERAAKSAAVSCRTALRMPTGSATSSETTIERSESVSVTGKRAAMSWPAGRLVQSEWPRSPRRSPPVHVTYCSTSGRSSPSRARSSAASLPYWNCSSIMSTTSPGIARMMANTKSETRTSVGTTSSSRFSA